MSAVYLSPRASERLVDIYRYSYDRFGEDQADKYLAGFYACFDQIARNERQSRSIPPEFGVTGFYLRYEKHFIYGRFRADGGVSVLEILHVSMMQGQRLREAFGITED